MYFMTACTQFEDDENPSNNCESNEVTMHFPYFDDVGVISIDSPNEKVFSETFPVKSTIKNFGQFSECCFKTYAEISEIDFTNQYTFWSEGFDDGYYYTLPTGWTENRESVWYFYPYWSYLPGEIPPNARLFWNTTEDGDWLMSPTVDTSNAAEMDLELTSFIDYFASGCSFYIEIRPGPSAEWIDITPWANPISGDVGPDTYTVDASMGIGLETQIRFRFSGVPYNFDYWYFDNISFIGYPVLEPEYTDFVCIEPFDPSETQMLEFQDWTPAGFEQGVSGVKTYRVKSWSKMCDPLDENSTNDASYAIIEISYLHDVAVKEITQPQGRRSRDNSWIYFDDGEVYSGIGLTGGGTFQGAIRITPDELNGYNGWELTKVKFYHSEVGTNNGDVIIYEAGNQTQPGSIITSESFSVTGEDWQEITLSTPIIVDENEDIWISINITHGNEEYPLAVDDGPAVDGKADWVCTDGVNWEELKNMGLNYNWMIRAYLVGEEEPDIYIGPGTYPIEAIILNNGTFTENNFTSYAKITKESEIIYESNFIIGELAAGEEETAVFDDWTVTEGGTYKLIINVSLENDDYLDNNVKTLLIGVDAEPPETTHTLNPAVPNGENDWYITCVTLTLKATDDGTGVETTYYRINGETWQTYTSAVEICNDDEYTIEYYSVDNVGNNEIKKTVSFKIDKTLPTIITIQKEQSGILIKTINFTAVVDDETSGIDRVEFYLDGEFQVEDTSPPYQWTWKGIGNHTVTVDVFDKAGNKASKSESTPLNNDLIQNKNNVVKKIINNIQVSQNNILITNNPTSLPLISTTKTQTLITR
jgi:translation elongation factor EF-1beta